VLAFHTHLLDLAPWFPGRLEEDAGAIGNLLACGYCLPGTTAFREIHHLSPGCHLAFEGGSVGVERHFRVISRAREDGATAAAMVEELGEILAESIGTAWRAAERPVLPLSGGLDSRYILAEAARQAGDVRLVRTITWGEERDRAPDCDGVIAARVAATVGVENVWCEQTQSRLDETSWQRAVYLSSGEADHAVRYPDDHQLHRTLVEDMGAGSLFRGDIYWGNNLLLPMTRRSVQATVDIMTLSIDDGTYGRLLDGDALRRMADGQTQVLAETLEGLQSSTPAGCYQELYYDFRMRQVLAVFNRVKHADLEVYNPLMARPLAAWACRLPDRYRENRPLYFETMRQRFPAVGSLPYAAVDNLPRWEQRFERDPRFARFYAEICSAPGWLDRYADKPAVIDALRAMERRATELGGPDASAALAARRPAPRPTLSLLDSWKRSAKHTPPGRLLYDLVRERRMKLPLYLKLGRLATLHAFLGQVESRRAKEAAAVAAASTR
jgi:hypothetical protein